MGFEEGSENNESFSVQEMRGSAWTRRGGVTMAAGGKHKA